MQVRHLAARFAGSLVPRGPEPDDEAWLVSLLNDREVALYEAQSRQDRRHSVSCAKQARAALGPRATTSIIVASALHDVGKTAAGLGTFGRVTATLVASVVSTGRLRGWADRAGFRGRVGRYHLHDVRGARLLADAGSHPLTIAWACEHHRPRSDWSMPEDVGEALWSADRAAV